MRLTDEVRLVGAGGAPFVSVGLKEFIVTLTQELGPGAPIRLDGPALLPSSSYDSPSMLKERVQNWEKRQKAE